ncbi:PREDICTED: VPS10 domain-containing receptor SorCS3-like, partial [Tinamus guttatus]|uniref:VPS10 domain-containing receptor SorCS3-like n=1 Tax=Tinamus guttatus TaxID=94827 RepID=UPI00052EF217
MCSKCSQDARAASSRRGVNSGCAAWRERLEQPRGSPRAAQALYSSMDFGRKWQLMQERVTPNRFYWSVTGLDKEPDLVHMEARTADGRTHYLTCRIQECSETKRIGPFSRSIDISSLVVQDEYIFTQ